MKICSGGDKMRNANGRSTIGFAGCEIWVFFVVILGMQAENRSGMREF